jgi:hypothetical protein
VISRFPEQKALDGCPSVFFFAHDHRCFQYRTFPERDMDGDRKTQQLAVTEHHELVSDVRVPRPRLINTPGRKGTTVPFPLLNKGDDDIAPPAGFKFSAPVYHIPDGGLAIPPHARVPAVCMLRYIRFAQNKERSSCKYQI